jgi:hypothetical protein
MTTDERIEALTMHLEVVTHMHEAFERKMTEYAADVKDAIGRLTNIVEAHDQQIDAHEERIERLEGK